ncbi:MAG: M24 family metallopeptidase [Mycobacteriaceae bacterium]
MNTSERFAAAVYSSRLTKAAALAAKADLAGLVIAPGPDLQYLIGSRASSFERLTALVVPSDGSVPTLILPQLELASLKESAVPELGLKISDWVDGLNPYVLVATSFTTSGLATPLHYAVSDSMPALHVLPLQEHLGATAQLATEVLRELRMIKDKNEIEELRKAGAAIDRVHAQVPLWLKAGRTEAQVAADITRAIIKEGHTQAAFVIVGSGPHGADPHHEVSDRVLEAGDIVVVDIGGLVAAGYYSDCTRTYSLGVPDPTIVEHCAVLERAQRSAVEQVRPGVSAESVDNAARGVLAEAGLAEAFVHRTGHGIGLSVHEEPYIVQGNNVILTEGMAFSVEPGIYFPGSWGARIEDIVVVTADGCEPLNHQPHGLTVVQ